MKVVVLMCAAILLMAAPGAAQGDMAMDMPGMSMTGAPLDLGESRDGSGTSWLPERTPVYGPMLHASGWMLMAHGRAFLQSITVTGDRGDRQVGSVNWIMGMAQRELGGGQFTARLMMSAEPLTVGRCGYPDLLQSGESCRGAALHDRQHPHDLFMEAAARYARPVSDRVAFEVYGGPVGEPALGPTAFPHRPSAWQQPIAPITHHWLDATHVSFGVVTGSVYGRRWKAEASAFNGREPDDLRYGIDSARWDSWSTRGSWMPSPSVVVQASTGLLREAEVEDGELVDIRRSTASLTHHRRAGDRLWATTLAWGRNEARGEASHAVLVETASDLTLRDTVFARGEWVQKSGHDLDFESVPQQTFGITKVQGGYTRWIGAGTGLRLGIGGTVGIGRVPPALRPAYGQHPVEAAIFATVVPNQTR
ncbi:MAG: hypothetical protein ABI634_13080 [Acidobacteriota bacterium]